MKIRFLIPWLIGLLVIPFAVVLSGVPVLSVIDPASFVVCFGIVFFMLLTHYSPKEMGRAFRLAATEVKASDKELKEAQVFFDSMFRMSILGGLLGTLLGWITIAALTGTKITPDMFGRGLSVSMLTTFYALILVGFVAIPFGSAIRKRLSR